MNAWEYCIVQVSANRILLSHFQQNEADHIDKSYRSLPKLIARLGTDGWELVSASVRDSSIDTDVSAEKFGSQLLYFKRPVGYVG